MPFGELLYSGTMWVPIILLLLSISWGCSPGAVDRKGAFYNGFGLDGVRIDLERPPTRVLPVTTQAAEFAAALIPLENLVGLPDSYHSMSSGLGVRVTREPQRILKDYRVDSVIAFDPELVIVGLEEDADVTARLRSTGLTVLSLPRVSCYGDIEESLGFLGRLLDAESRASQVLQDMELRRQALAQGSASWRGASGLLYARDSSGAWTQGLQSRADVLLELVGLVNAASLGDLRGDYRIDNERLLALDPDVIVVQSTARDANAHPFMDLPALNDLVAVKTDRVLTLPPDLFQTSSQRIVDAAEELSWRIEESGLGSR